MFEYRKNEKLLRIHFIGGNTVTIGTMEPERFEKVAAILKYGKVK
jgi:hypothetical protein